MGWERGQAEGRHLEETPLELTDFLMGMLRLEKNSDLISQENGAGGEDG